MALDEYVFDRCEDFHRCGASILKLETSNLAGELALIEASLAFGRTLEGILIVRELIEEIQPGRPHRLQYSYHFMYRDQFLFRYDRDPDNHPEMPDHKHLSPGDRRVPSGPVTLREVLEEVYDLIGELERD